MEWREIAEWDWVQVGDTETDLHAVDTLDEPVEDEWGGEGRTACGRHGYLSIPGLLSRMGAWRCEKCCAVTGMPPGKQSPKNADECRPVVEARLATLV